MCSSRISCTVRATMTLWLRLKNDSISCNASDEKSNDTKKPFSQSSRIIMASKASMSGRPALSFCFTWMGYQCSFRPSSPSCCLRGAGGDGEDAAIHAHVAHLHLVRDAAKGDDGPVLKFKRRDDAQLLDRPFDHSSVPSVPASARSCCASAGEWPPPLYRAIPGWRISPRARRAKNASRNSAPDGRAA